jgi:ubiquinone/menaquinone biosynthesis C-methylase UbiE
MKQIYSNEKWWQENGLGWADEVEKRRALQPLYGIQEVVLSSYFATLPQHSKVLEFGVGFGRHVEYLDELSNISVYAVDQSPTMLESLRLRLAEKKELLERITLIEPRTTLPYPDNYFDIVYTVSVLIHIQPEHLSGILQELVRVSKHGIVHFENNESEKSEFAFPDHNGCWRHAIVKEYKKLNLNCKVLTKVAEEQDLYFVALSDDSRFHQIEKPVMFKRLHMIDKRIRPQMQFFEGEVGWRTEELKKRQETEFELKEEINNLKYQLNTILSDKNNLKQEVENLMVEKQKLIQENINLRNEYELQINDLEEERNSLQLQFNTLQSEVIYQKSVLEEIQSSLAWILISKFRNNTFLYSLSKPLRKCLKKLKKSTDRIVPFVSQQNKSIISDEIINIKKQLEGIPSNSDIAIYHPEWLGVSHSTKELFDYTLAIQELHSHDKITELATILCEKMPRSITFSGFAIGYYELARQLKKMNSGISIKVFWHGNTTHMYEDYSWMRYQEIFQLCVDGVVDSWGFAKESMARVYSNINIVPSFFVMNHIEPKEFADIKIDYSTKERINIGLYASGHTWNKNAYTQIAAASLMKNVKINAIPFNSRMKQFAQQLHVELDGFETQIPREKLMELMGENDINFYVTFSECAPLLPLESMNMGIPCLTGPNHHYFNNSPLKEYLVVNSPDDPVEIAAKAEQALNNKELIINLYKEWLQSNHSLSKQSIDVFLGREY